MDNTENKIKKVLDEIRPALQAHGGNVEFISFEQKTGAVKVKLQGACRGCLMAEMTLKGGIEEALKKEIEEVKKVVA